MEKRRSIREYRKDIVPLEKIGEILDAGRYAPSPAKSPLPETRARKPLGQTGYLNGYGNRKL
jgi:nitroreductase